MSQSEQASASDIQKIFELWTDERIKEAKPKAERSREVPQHEAQALREKYQAAVGNNTPATIVPDTDLTKFPYQSAGRLFFDVKGVPYSGSAYVADLKGAKNILFTAAHNLWDAGVVSNNFLFIPAMKDKNDTSGSLYGKYAGTKIAWCSKWDPAVDDPQYDFGTVTLAPRTTDGKNVGDVVTPFPVIWDATNQSGVEWLTLGYPSSRTDNPDKKMMQQNGAFVSQKNNIVSDVAQGGRLGGGASGGVWIRGGTGSANGVYTGGLKSTPEVAESPYFTPSILPP